MKAGMREAALYRREWTLFLFTDRERLGFTLEYQGHTVHDTSTDPIFKRTPSREVPN